MAFFQASKWAIGIPFLNHNNKDCRNFGFMYGGPNCLLLWLLLPMVLQLPDDRPDGNLDVAGTFDVLAAVNAETG